MNTSSKVVWSGPISDSPPGHKRIYFFGILCEESSQVLLLYTVHTQVCLYVPYVSIKSGRTLQTYKPNVHSHVPCTKVFYVEECSSLLQKANHQPTFQPP